MTGGELRRLSQLVRPVYRAQRSASGVARPVMRAFKLATERLVHRTRLAHNDHPRRGKATVARNPATSRAASATPIRRPFFGQAASASSRLRPTKRPAGLLDALGSPAFGALWEPHGLQRLYSVIWRATRRRRCVPPAGQEGHTNGARIRCLSLIGLDPGRAHACAVPKRYRHDHEKHRHHELLHGSPRLRAHAR